MTDDQVTQLAGYFESMRQELLAEMREGFEKSEAANDRILNILDGVAGRLDIDDTERVAQDSHLNRLEDRTVDHERRIVRLEKRTA